MSTPPHPPQSPLPPPSTITVMPPPPSPSRSPLKNIYTLHINIFQAKY